MNLGYKPRKKGTRKPLRKVIIVCEGKKTEVNYFNGFKTRGSGVDIIPIYGKCTDPKSIVSYAEERVCKWDIDFSEGDSIWCAFDADENKTSAINDAYEHAKTRKINIALSNPSFELWFLLHYKEVFSRMSRQRVILELKEYIPDYEKSKKVNLLLLEKLGGAIKRAKKLNLKHKKEDYNLYSAESNPSTQVFQLIEFIQDLMKKNKTK